MKKLLFALLCASIGLSSCNDNEVGIEDEKVAVAIEMLTPDNSGLSIKSEQASTVERGVTPACIKTLTIKSDHSTMSDESKVFTFTNPTTWWGSTPGSDENDHTTTTVDGLTMDLWGGQQTLTATTTSFVEVGHTDPMTSESDGVSSGGSTDEFIQWGEGEGTAQIADALRAIPPYATFETEAPVSYFAMLDKPETVKLNMVTENSRMIYTFEFEAGVAGYEGVVSFPRFDSEGVSLPNAAPNRSFTKDNAAWYYWSNADAVDGASAKPVITITDGQKVRVIDMATLDQKHKDTDVNICTLIGGMDIWNKVVITAAGLKLEGNGFEITYNWEEINNEIEF